MNPEDIIKAAPEIVKTVAPIATGAAIAFTGVVKRMLGPAADELAEMWRDQVRLYRYERQMKCVEKAEKMAKDAGFTPKAVPPKILFPLLEGASLEENENLHDMWAALLANAASPENANSVRPGFIATLKQLAPDEAALLNWMFSKRVGSDYDAFRFAVLARLLEKQTDKQPLPFDTPFSHSDLTDGYCSPGFGSGTKTVDGIAFETCIYDLESSKLIQVITGGRSYLSANLTFRGAAFVAACSPPMSAKKSDSRAKSGGL